VLPDKYGGYVVGALVQANFGRRFQLTIAGAPIGQHLTEDAVFTHGENPLREQGSVIAIIATDAPLLPYQLKRLAKRAPLGMARTGGMAGNGSGDIFLAFSSANPGAARPKNFTATLQALPNDQMDPLIWAVVYAVEEAILNALVAAETMTGRAGLRVPAIPHDRLRQVLRQYDRLVR
jgi:L-aminopeptidase/D-esterase-like protein